MWMMDEGREGEQRRVLLDVGNVPRLREARVGACDITVLTIAQTTSVATYSLTNKTSPHPIEPSHKIPRLYPSIKHPSLRTIIA